MNNDIYLNNYKDRSIFESNCIEFWAPITDRIVPGILENRYFVSSRGNTYNSHTKRPIGLSMHRKGYKQFAVMTKDQKQVTKKLHRYIMETFCWFPGCEMYEVNHIDGNKLNNDLYNLEWCTHSENTIHAINNGLKTVFGHTTKVILTDDDVKNILYLRDKGYIPIEIKSILNLDPSVSRNLIENVCLGNARQSYHNNLYNNH